MLGQSCTTSGGAETHQCKIGAVSLPKIVLDTSALNRLRKDLVSGPILKALAGCFDVIFTGASLAELIATPREKGREALLRQCDPVLASARCIWPPAEIIRLLVVAHLRDAVRFSWTTVDVGAEYYKPVILRRHFSDATCIEQRHQHFRLESAFKKYWTDCRSRPDPILAKDPSMRPTTYHEAAAIAALEGGVLWDIGQGLYSFVAKKPLLDSELRAILDACPPFRAVCYALVMSRFNWSLRPHDDRTAVAGRNDLMTAAYLPYCERFITDDWAHRRSLREIAIEAKLECEILSVDELIEHFAVGA